MLRLGLFSLVQHDADEPPNHAEKRRRVTDVHRPNSHGKHPLDTTQQRFGEIGINLRGAAWTSLRGRSAVWARLRTKPLLLPVGRGKF